MHRDLAALLRLVAVADDEVVDPEVEGNVAFGLVDLRSFGRHDGQTLAAVSARRRRHGVRIVETRVGAPGRRTRLPA